MKKRDILDCNTIVFKYGIFNEMFLNRNNMSYVKSNQKINRRLKRNYSSGKIGQFL